MSLVRHYNEHQTVLHRNIFYVEKEQDGVMVEVALQYVDDISERIVAFANNTYNSEGGTHVTGFKTALTRTINTYAKKANVIKEADGPFSGEDVLEGLTYRVQKFELEEPGQKQRMLSDGLPVVI